MSKWSYVKDGLDFSLGVYIQTYKCEQSVNDYIKTTTSYYFLCQWKQLWGKLDHLFCDKNSLIVSLEIESK